MNPFLQHYIEQIENLTRQLEATLKDYDQRLQACREKNKKQVEENWVMVRKIRSLEETITRLPAMHEENKDLRQKNEQSVAHAKNILALTKILGDALR